MVTRQPDYNRAFHCLGGDCPDTCCRDWEIVLDEEALEDYQSAPEPLRSQVVAGLTVDETGDTCFRLREDGTCALLTPEGLCPIQRDWGEEHLCAHCGAYPRFTEEFGCLTETALAVSCPEAARLLMERTSFVLLESDDGGDEPPFDGVDGGLLRGLEATRASALAALNDNSSSIWRRLAGVLELAEEGQDCMDFEDYGGLAQCRVCPAEPEEERGRRLLTARLMKTFGELEPLRPAWRSLLERRSGELAAMSEQEYAEMRGGYERACPGWERRLANLACYLVFRHWHKAVNDDNLYGRAALTAAACLLIYHLSALAWWEAGRFDRQQEALLWSAFSREVEHMEGNVAYLIELLWDQREWPLK